MFSSIRSYISHFRRPILVILAVVVIFGLVLGVYVYGKDQRQDSDNNQQAQTDQTQDASSSAQQGAANPQPDQSGNNAQPPVVSTGPSDISNTGPEDWAPWATTAMVLGFWYWRRSRKLLSAQVKAN